MAQDIMGPRFVSPARTAFTPEQQTFYERYATGSRADPGQPFRLVNDAGDLIGPPSVWVVDPDIGLALAGIGYQMRWGIDFSEKAREAVILAVGYTLESPFELYAHESAARAVGWIDGDFAMIQARRHPKGADEQVRVALDVAWCILDTGVLDESTYTHALGVFGIEHLFQLVTLVTYYRMVATQLAVFGILPPDQA